MEIEGEDYDGQSGATKETATTPTWGNRLRSTSGSYVYFENVDFSDAGVAPLQLRVAAQSDTTLELHADSQTGPLLGTCAVTATGGLGHADLHADRRPRASTAVRGRSAARPASTG